MEYVYSLREGLPRLPTYAEKSSKGLNLIVRAFDGERGGGAGAVFAFKLLVIVIILEGVGNTPETTEVE